MIIPDHWLVRGAQSAIFFYISCAPCLGVSYSRRRKKEAARDRKLKEAELARRPHMYAHPGPAEMNEHWREELELGPFPYRKRQRKGTKDSAGRSTGKQAADSLASFDSTREGDVSSRVPRKKKYKRADEEILWTMEEEDYSHPKSKTTSDYRVFKAPPINDLHPAIVSMIPLSPDDRRWMKEVPPSTDFLDGKAGVTIVGRNTSSKTSRRANPPLINQPIPSISTEDTLYPGPATSGNVIKGQRAANDRLNTPISRPDSAISTGRRARYRPVSSRLQAGSSTSSDADDDEEFLPTRPRQVYCGDGPPSRQRSRRSQLASVTDRDSPLPSVRTSMQTPPQFSPALRPQSMNDENLSLKTSPRSAVSLESPFSSEDDNLPLSRVRSSRHKNNPPKGISAMPSHTLPARSSRQPEHVIKQTSLRPLHLLRTSKSHTETDSYSTPGAEEVTEILSGLRLREIESSIDLGIDVGRVLEWRQLSEKAAKEHMWLGPAPVRSENGVFMEKRHSTDF